MLTRFHFTPKPRSLLLLRHYSSTRTFSGRWVRVEVWGCESESGGRRLLNSLTDGVKNWGLGGFKTTLMTVKERKKTLLKSFFFFFNASDYWVQRGEHERGTGFLPAPLLPCRFVPRLRGHCQLAAKSCTILSPAPSTGAPPPTWRWRSR